MTITNKTPTVVFIDTVADRLDGRTLGLQKAGNMPDRMTTMIAPVSLGKSTPVLKNEVLREVISFRIICRGEQIAIARNYSYPTASDATRDATQGKLGGEYNRIFEVGNTAECQQRDFEGAVNGNWARTIGKPSSIGMDDGIPAELGGVGANTPAWLAGIGRSGWWERNQPPDRAGIGGKQIKGRRVCINHYGAACIRVHAAPMALRIKYLARILDQAF